MKGAGWKLDGRGRPGKRKGQVKHRLRQQAARKFKATAQKLKATTLQPRTSGVFSLCEPVPSSVEGCLQLIQ
ncbi:MAG: hypothetical protein IGQ88_00250 [Gloeomargaritaceae cyanobacterium C42_A2020_066]|nr:hypothetical protein [Gloeomargaritaceae cyanobacterium C42_A2020_066]